MNTHIDMHRERMDILRAEIRELHAAVSTHLTLAELKAAEKHCEWPAFKHAFAAVMKMRRAAIHEALGTAAHREGESNG